jgi:hypothetical protein
MELTQQVAALVFKLLELSQMDKVDWQETADEKAFLASVSKFVVTIGKEDFDPRPDYLLRVADQTGKTLEDARVSRREPYYTELESLYELARRRALHVDEALSDLLSSLENIK